MCTFMGNGQITNRDAFSFSFLFADRMINDPKSAQFIAWTELGASFVVSNVGEFSRSILGSHFKHNNVCYPPLFIRLLPPFSVSGS